MKASTRTPVHLPHTRRTPANITLPRSNDIKGVVVTRTCILVHVHVHVGTTMTVHCSSARRSSTLVIIYASFDRQVS